MSLEREILSMILMEGSPLMTKGEDKDEPNTITLHFKPYVDGLPIILKAIQEALIKVSPQIIEQSLEYIAYVRKEKELNT